MKYTFIDDNNKSIVVNIPDEFIAINRRNLGLTTQQAIDLWLSDEGYLVDKQVQELTEKAKQAGIEHGVSPKKRKQQKPRTPDLVKNNFMRQLFDWLMLLDKPIAFEQIVHNVELVNPNRLISFQIGNDQYELTLTKRRNK